MVCWRLLSLRVSFYAQKENVSSRTRIVALRYDRQTRFFIVGRFFKDTENPIKSLVFGIDTRFILTALPLPITCHSFAVVIGNDIRWFDLCRHYYPFSRRGRFILASFTRTPSVI